MGVQNICASTRNSTLNFDLFPGSLHAYMLPYPLRMLGDSREMILPTYKLNEVL